MGTNLEERTDVIGRTGIGVAQLGNSFNGGHGFGAVVKSCTSICT